MMKKNILVANNVKYIKSETSKKISEIKVLVCKILSLENIKNISLVPSSV